MLTKKQMRTMKIVGTALFTLATFTAMFLSLVIINKWGNYEKSVGFILITAFGVTAIFTTEYALVRKPLLHMIEKIEERLSKMKLIKWLETTDKKKIPEEILWDAALDGVSEFEESVPCEKIWKLVSDWYGVDWMQLTGIDRKAGMKKERRICMYLMNQCGKLNYDEIAEEMGLKNREKVFYEIHELCTAMKKDKKQRDEVLDIIEGLK